MASKSKRPCPPSGRTNLASCVVATIFLTFIIIVILIVYCTVFQPQDPKIAVQLPSLSVVNSTVNFTFAQYAFIKNLSRAAFSHYDSSLHLLYSVSQVGFTFILASEIDSSRMQYMAATFSVQSFLLLGLPAPTGWPTMANGEGPFLLSRPISSLSHPLDLFLSL